MALRRRGSRGGRVIFTAGLIFLASRISRVARMRRRRAGDRPGSVRANNPHLRPERPRRAAGLIVAQRAAAGARAAAQSQVAMLAPFRCGPVAAISGRITGEAQPRRRRPARPGCAAWPGAPPSWWSVRARYWPVLPAPPAERPGRSGRSGSAVTRACPAGYAAPAAAASNSAGTTTTCGPGDYVPGDYWPSARRRLRTRWCGALSERAG
jgi:hypothetical protein